MAFSKEQKQALVKQYEGWLTQSQAVFILNYTKITNKQIEGMRRRLREVGGYIHICKNTLMKVAMNNSGYAIKERISETSMISFAMQDPAAVAKVLADLVKEFDGKLDFKVGFLEKNQLAAADIKALATLPPLPVMRAQILGTILAPASKLVRTINEPGSQVARVLKAYAEK